MGKDGLQLKKTVEVSGSVVEIERDDIVLVAKVVLDSNKKYEIDRTGSFNEILESIRRKINVLPYVSEDAYGKLVEEILIDFAKMICKFEIKQRE